MTRTASAALLLALCALAELQAGPEVDEPPPQNFPDSKSVPFDSDKVPTPKTPVEVIEMNSAGAGDTKALNAGGGRGSILACALPDSLRAPGADGSASDVAKVCHLPVQWLHGASASGTLRVCSIPHDAWNSSYTVTDGTLPKELLTELNTSSVKCVTPSEALSGGGKGSIANGSFPSAWLRDSNDTIYIYIIPQEWLRTSHPPAPTTGSASEVEDLTKDTPTPAPDSSSTASAAVTTVASSRTVSPNYSTKAPAPYSSSNTPSAVKAAEFNDTSATSNDPAVVPVTSATATDYPKGKTTKGTHKAEAQSMIATQKSVDNVTVGMEDNATGTLKEIVNPEAYSDAAAWPSPEALSQQQSSNRHAASSGKTAFLQPTESAAIMAGVFVAVALLGYAGLLLWRRVLEKRYGNREMLVNEDDDFDSTDTRHFEL